PLSGSTNVTSCWIRQPQSVLRGGPGRHGTRSQSVRLPNGHTGRRRHEPPKSLPACAESHRSGARRSLAPPPLNLAQFVVHRCSRRRISFVMRVMAVAHVSLPREPGPYLEEKSKIGAPGSRGIALSGANYG